ncbi:MAG: glutamate--tRNA ligase [Deltaproteobacteria bacterium]|nr:MAG: glutamate--tRNA ligase [Deltaproteobacteria bacterium]
MKKIITRFPPSPTGHLHVGGARTALFNWLYARHMGGKFVLRFEDTDAARSTQASVDGILESLEWLGIDWDDGPYFQTQRYDLYQSYIDKLIASGHAYYCDCTPAQVDAMREAAKAKGLNPQYDGSCRDKGLKKSDKTVVRFRSPDTGSTVIEDTVRGSIAWPNTEMDDFIIQRSDGSPMYNLAVVIDDITMGITTIIRGDDHISNTPKQIQLYKALGEALPEYAHVPMVLGSDRSRLSKRHGAMSVTEYRDMGFLADGLINYLVRLGWSHGDQEFFTRKALIDAFSLDHIGRAAGVFDPDKLLAINAQHIQHTPVAELAPLLTAHLAKTGIPSPDPGRLTAAIPLLAPRSKTLADMATQAAFFFEDPLVYDEKAAAKFLVPDNAPVLTQLTDALSAHEAFDEKGLEPPFLSVMDTTGLKFGKVAQPVRVALTGKTASPGILETIAVLGKAETVKRLKAAVNFIQSKD